MKNTISKTNIVLGGALLAMAFIAIMGAFPGTASAYSNGYSYDYQYGGGYGSGYGSAYHYDSYCAYPQTAQIAPNGYYTCSYPSAPAQPVYPQPQPYYPQPVYNPLTASCYANSSSVAVGSGVTWSASASGGYGSYSYSWYGSDSLSGYGQTAYATYYSPGTKTASVVVSSGGQSVTISCGNTVNVYGYQQPIVYQPTYVQPQPIYTGPNIISTNVSGLDIGCYSDPSSALVNQPVTWNVEVTGGVAPYRYSWSGSDGLSGESNVLIKYYSTSGPKNALVTVTSADGRSATKACSNAIAIRSNAPAPVKVAVVQTKPVVIQDNSNLSAGALFSLSNIPWGWVAVLVILVLFITVMYLLFNKPKM